NPEMVDILELTLQYGPATVLTNGTILKENWLHRLARAEAKSRYSLEFRVSIDGYSAEQNDPIRGPGTFGRAMQGEHQLLENGFLPIITVTRVQEDDRIFEELVGVMKVHGYERPRIKVLPLLRIGAEVERGRGYREEERVTADMMDSFDRSQLLC